MDQCLDYTFNKLLLKYRNTKDIKPIEFYDELMSYHSQRMGIGEDIPLWMNNRIYNELNISNKKIK